VIKLRDYQEGALEAITASESKRQLVALPTGTGKTVVFSSLIQRLGRDAGWDGPGGAFSALILAHRDELLQQAADKLTQVAPELAMSIGFVKAKLNDTRMPVVVGSVQTLAVASRLQQMPEWFDLIIVDEAHHATAPSYRRILDRYPEALVVGFTATPERHGKKGATLNTVFDDMVYARSIEEMIRQGYLADLRAIRVTLEDLNLKAVKKSGGDFQAEALGSAMEDAHALEHAVEAWREHAEGRRTIAFFPTVATSIAAAALFREAGVRAQHLDGETPAEHRRAIIAALAAGDVDVVCNVGVLTEGFDEPSLGCILIAAPTQSRIKYAQMVGRGTRLYPGKDDCLILDIAGVSGSLSIQSVGTLFGLKRDPKPGERATDAVDREAEEELAEAQAAHDAEAAAKAQAELDKRRRRAAAADLFHRDKIHWQRHGERWLVGLRENFIVCEPTGAGSFRVLLMMKNKMRVVAKNLDFGYASGVAEQMIRDASAIALVNKEAPWRQQPASPGQLRRLRAIAKASGVEAPVPATKGEASDLIDAAEAAGRLERWDAVLREREQRSYLRCAACGSSQSIVLTPEGPCDLCGGELVEQGRVLPVPEVRTRR
jgi:superfamily II DNA or RNA helicase